MNNRSLHKDLFVTQSLVKHENPDRAVPQKLVSGSCERLPAFSGTLPTISKNVMIGKVRSPSNRGMERDDSQDSLLRNMAIFGYNKLNAEVAAVRRGDSLVRLNPEADLDNSIFIEK